MPEQFGHSFQPVLSTYPQISAAAREIAGEVIVRINRRAEGITETWKSSVICAVCGEDHEPLPRDIFPARGKPMDEHSRKKMMLQDVVQLLNRMI